MKPKALVVDDEESIRMLLTDILEDQDFDVVTAENGVEGVRLTFSETPDVVLTDIMMPDMNGISFLQRIRTKIPASSLPVIVISALGMEAQIVQAFQAGATDYLVKPFRPSELIARIQVARQRRVDPQNVVYKERDRDSKLLTNIAAGSVLDMGKYRIVSEIGSGGMGTVYQAKHLGYGIDVALKVLKPEIAEDQKSVLRFLREVRIAARMNHPNIVQVFDVGLSGDCYYYAMENLPRRSLYSIVRGKGAQEEDFVLDVGIQLASALKYIHMQDLMHRDVKPDNVLVQDDGCVKLIDFGLACSTEDARLTREGSFMGTPGYVAPENIQKYRAPDPSGDIYSLGATLYFAAAGKSPFFGRNGSTQKLIAQVQETPVALGSVSPGISRGLSGVVSRMMERDQKKRYAHVAEALEDLEELKAAR
jgi:serine/threonine protein kinase/CheY-like chemotaxis protein